MAESLLASLYKRIAGAKEEDVATMSLQYILAAYPKLNSAFNNYLSSKLKITLDPNIQYRDQSIGENLERPDLSGADLSGREQILCEMKFYAGLTDNQPNGYLDRLIKEDGKALMFVCPQARIVSLWSKVKELCLEKGRVLSEEEEYRITVDGIAMGVTSWSDIILVLKTTADSQDVSALADIAQLEGFCNRMDQDAFIPFAPEELGSDTARREFRFYDLIDEVTDELGRRKEFNPRKKGKQSAWRGGYWRNITIKSHRIEIIYHRDIWRESLADTPFWLKVMDEDGNQTEEYKKYLNARPIQNIHHHYTSSILLALYIKPYAPKDEVVDDLVRQILTSLDQLDEALSLA